MDFARDNFFRRYIIGRNLFASAFDVTTNRAINTLTGKENNLTAFMRGKISQALFSPLSPSFNIYFFLLESPDSTRVSLQFPVRRARFFREKCRVCNEPTSSWRIELWYFCVIYLASTLRPMIFKRNSSWNIFMPTTNFAITKIKIYSFKN